MHNFHNDGIELTEEQRQRAEEALEQIKRGEVTHPKDLLDEWKACPEWQEIDRMYEGDVYKESVTVEKWIPISNIVGTVSGNIDRFKKSRIESAFQRLLDGRFEPDHSRKPHYIEVGGDLYVGADGNHRSIACKVVGLDKILARVSEAPVNEAAYQRWTARRDGTLVQTQDRRQFSEISTDEQAASVSIGEEIMIALGRRRLPTSTPEVLFYIQNPEQCDKCGKLSNYVYEYMESRPRQILGIEAPWSKFYTEIMCHECWIDSTWSDSFYTPDDPALLFDENMPKENADTES